MLEKYIELLNTLIRRLERYEEMIRLKAPSLMITNEKRLIKEAASALDDFLSKNNNKPYLQNKRIAMLAFQLISTIL